MAFDDMPYSIKYNAINKVQSIKQGEQEAKFIYLPSEERIQMTLTNQQGQDSMTKYYGINYEIEINHITNTQKEFAYINSPEGLIAVICKDSNTTNHSSLTTPHYIHTDYLGSIIAISDQQGNITNKYAYDAWGRPRNAETWSYKTAQLPIFQRGYTSHEHLAVFGLINMNYRLYDPVNARFISSDNMIPNITHTQSYNLYSYVLNNPLKYTDPDGHHPILLAMLIYGGLSALNYTLNIAFQPGGFDNWSWTEFGKSVAIGAASGAITCGIGTGIAALGGATGMVGTEAGRLGLELIRAGAHGAAQGGLSVLQGGSFGSGFLSGALGSLGGSAFRSVGGDFAKSFWGVTAFSALAGGVGSKLGGGSFWQGALTGATIGALNHGLNQLANGVEDKIRNKMLNRRFANMMRQYKGKVWEMGEKGPNAFDCSGSVVDGINKTLGTNAIDIDNTSADKLFKDYSTLTTNDEGSLQFYDYRDKVDGVMDHVTTNLGNGTMMHGSSSAKIFKIIPVTGLNSYTNSHNGAIFHRDVNWNIIINR